MSTGNDDISPGCRVTKSRSFLRFARKKNRRGKRTEIKKKLYTPRCSVVTNRKWEPQRSTGVTVRKLRVLNSDTGIFQKKSVVNISSNFWNSSLPPLPPLPSSSGNAGTTCFSVTLLYYNSERIRAGRIDILIFDTHCQLYYCIIMYYSLSFRLYV